MISLHCLHVSRTLKARAAPGFQCHKFSPRFCVCKGASSCFKFHMHVHNFSKTEIIYIQKDPYILNPHATMTVQWTPLLIFSQVHTLKHKNNKVTSIFSLRLSFSWQASFPCWNKGLGKVSDPLNAVFNQLPLLGLFGPMALERPDTIILRIVFWV